MPPANAAGVDDCVARVNTPELDTANLWDEPLFTCSAFPPVVFSNCNDPVISIAFVVA